MSNKYLIVILRFHGDVLLTKPMIDNIKLNDPDGEIDLLLYKGTGSILEQEKSIGEIIEIDNASKANIFSRIKKEINLWAKVRSKKYNYAFFLTTQWRVVPISWAIGKAMKSAVDDKKRRKSLWTKSFSVIFPEALDNHIKGRFDGYCQALKKNNIEFDQDWVMPIHPHHPKLLRLDREQLENAILNTSVVFAANGSCGLVAYETLKAMNLKMPDDKPLLVYDDFDDFDKIDPTISAIRSNYEEIGKLLIQKSNEMINKGFRNDLRIQVNGQLMLRDTA